MVVVEVADGVTATVKTMVTESLAGTARRRPRTRRSRRRRAASCDLRRPRPDARGRFASFAANARSGRSLRGPSTRRAPDEHRAPIPGTHGAPPSRARVPPHSIEAEQSVLGAILLSDRTLYALVIEEGLRAEDFYRERHRTIYEAMLALYGDERADRRPHGHRAPALARQARGGRRRRPRSTRSPAAAPSVGSAAPLRADRQGPRAPAAAAHGDLRDPGRASPATTASPRDLVERAERAMLEVAHDDRQKDFRTGRRRPPRRDRQVAEAVDRGPAAHRHAVGLRGPRRDHRRLPARQPDRHRRAARRWASPRSSRTSPRTPRSTGRPRPVALFSLEMSEAELAQRFIASQAAIKGDDLRKGRAQGRASGAKILRRRRRATTPRRSTSTTRRDIGILEIRAKARRLHQQTPDGLGLIIVDYLQLMRADARIENRVQQVGEMSRGLKILARELERPGHRALAAQPRASSRAPTSARCSPTCASPGRSSRTPTS